MMQWQFDTYNLSSPVYNAHSEPKFYWDLFLPNLLKFALALPGLVCNPALVYITCKEKSLHGPCNILLAIGALFDFLYLAGFCLPLLLTLLTINFIPLQACFFLTVVPLSSLFSSVSTVFFIGFDRLLNVLLPYHYHRINQLLYLTIDMAIVHAYSVYAISLGVPGVWSHPNWPATCAQSEMYSFLADSRLSQYGVYINGASFLCYILVWFLIWKLKKQATMHGLPETSGNDEPRSRIFKSVLMIMFLVVGVWLFNVVYTTLLARFLTDPFSTSFIAPTVSLLTVLIASTTNPPILYICSKEYRWAFQRLLLRIPLLRGYFKKLFTHSNTTVVCIQQQHVAKGHTNNNNNSHQRQENSVHPFAVPVSATQQQQLSKG